MRLAGALLALLIVTAAGCSSSAEPDGQGMASPTATRQAASLLTPPPEVRPIQFPDDEAPHDNMTEWWYYTGHMFDDEGNRFGFEFVMFQVQRGNFPAFYASHFAITDNSAGAFVYDEKSGFDGLIKSERGFHLRLEDWEMQGQGGTDALRADMDGYQIDLTLTTDRVPVLHNQGTGYMEIGLAGGSYYYSRPGMKLRGTLTVDGEPLHVTGSAWMDHQWGDFVLVDGGGWDWFAIQLDDDSALMMFQLRGIEDLGDIPDFGTLILPNDEPIHLAESDYTIGVNATWTSDATGATYPSGWTVSIPDHDMMLVLEPTLPDQELDTSASTGTIYWEGEVVVTGERNGTGLTGLGYVELTGYAAQDGTTP